MSLSAGTSLGAHSVIAKIREVEMGEVYQVTDARSRCSTSPLHGLLGHNGDLRWEPGEKDPTAGEPGCQDD